MATIDIGKIKPVFKGTYDNSTAYVLDDIVYYNGSSYVAKTSTTGNLPTDATKWNVLASGSGGIWDSTLSLGSAGQAVIVNSGANALEFGNVGADFTPQFHAYQSSNQGIQGSTQTRLVFDTETFDTDNAFNNTSGNYSFTVPSGKAGKYWIYGQTRKNNFSGSRFYCQVKCTGTTTKTILTAENTYAGDTYVGVQWFKVEPLVVGDVVHCEIYTNDSGTRYLIGDQESTWFGMYRLSD